MLNIFSKLTGLAGKAKLIAVAVLVVIIIACAVVTNSKENTINQLRADVHRLTLERELTLADLQLARGELDRQNELIAQRTAAMYEARDAADKEIAALRAASGRVKTQVIEKLVTDPSCENQLRLIKEAQGVFYEE